MNGAHANAEAAPAATHVAAAKPHPNPVDENVDAMASAANKRSDHANNAEQDQMRAPNAKEDGAQDAKDADNVPRVNTHHVDEPCKAENEQVSASNGSKKDVDNAKAAHSAPSMSHNVSEQLKKAEDAHMHNDANGSNDERTMNKNNIDQAERAQHEPVKASNSGENAENAQGDDETCKTQGEDADKQKENSSSLAAKMVRGKLSDQQKEISNMIAETVSDEAAKQYTQATEIIQSAPDEGALQKASELLVKALRSAEDKDEAGLAYAELSLTYGQVMLGFVIRRATGGGVLGNGADAEDAEEDVVEEEEEEQITWTQLEIARVTLEKLVAAGNGRLRARLAETHRTLGELLVALDQASQAGAEFGKASELCEGRDRAECLHKLYLAMRREDKAVAGDALRKCITALEGAGGAQDQDVLRELRDELRVFAGEGGAAAGLGSGGGAEGGTAVKVVKVVPKRKREGGGARAGADAAAKRERLG